MVGIECCASVNVTNCYGFLPCLENAKLQLDLVKVEEVIRSTVGGSCAPVLWCFVSPVQV